MFPPGSCIRISYLSVCVPPRFLYKNQLPVCLSVYPLGSCIRISYLSVCVPPRFLWARSWRRRLAGYLAVWRNMGRFLWLPEVEQGGRGTTSFCPMRTEHQQKQSWAPKVRRWGCGWSCGPWRMLVWWVVFLLLSLSLSLFLLLYSSAVIATRLVFVKKTVLSIQAVVDSQVLSIHFTHFVYWPLPPSPPSPPHVMPGVTVWTGL